MGTGGMATLLLRKNGDTEVHDIGAWSKFLDSRGRGASTDLAIICT
jgi:hypothetical protein